MNVSRSINELSYSKTSFRNLLRNRFRRCFDSYLLSKFDFVIQKVSFYCKFLIILIIRVIVRDKYRDKVMIRCKTCIFDEVIFHISYQSIYHLFIHLLIYSNLICKLNRSKSKTSKHDMSTSVDVNEMSSVINVDKIEDRDLAIALSFRRLVVNSLIFFARDVVVELIVCSNWLTLYFSRRSLCCWSRSRFCRIDRQIDRQISR